MSTPTNNTTSEWGLENDLYLRALLREQVPRTPVWVMRQAGRYLPEYRETRKAAGDFLTLCKNPELACEVTMQPLRRFNLDAAIIFSDILTIPDAMGLGLYFETGEGPKFKRPVASARDIVKLKNPEDELQYVMDAISVTRKTINGAVPLIGFSGSPWTLAVYMVEGSGTKDFAKVKGMMYSAPKLMHTLLEKITTSVINYLTAQVHAGAQALMVFDTWGGVLSPECYRSFSLAYMKRIVDALPRSHNGARVPVVLFTKNGGQWLSEIAGTGCDGVGVDWTTDLSVARQRTFNSVALQGNLDPSVLYGSPESIRKEVKKVLSSYGYGPGHVFNLGHGIHQHVEPKKLGIMIDAVAEFSQQPIHNVADEAIV